MEKKLKIAFLSLTYGAVERGGETFIKQVSDRLRSFGHEVEIVAGRRPHAPRWPILWRLFIDPQGIRVCIFTLKNLSRIWREKYDVVIPIDGGWQVKWVRLVTWLYGGKVVISGQSGIGWDDRINLLAFPDAFVAISQRAENWAKKFNPLVRSMYIPDGVDLTKFKPSSKKFVTKLRKPIVVCVAALIAKKRVDRVVKAVSRLDGVSLLVVGSGELREKLGAMGKNLLEDKFEIVSVKHEQMPEIYRVGDVFSLVSEDREAFGIVFAEAMASGLPVVASDDPIRREIVGKAGLFVDPTDTQAYAAALQKALNVNWGDKPRHQAEKFDWDKIAKKYEELFLELCRK